MSVEIKVPALGESVTEATIAKWLKAAGDSVAVDEPLVELETDKVSLEVPSSVAGVLSEILVQAGSDVAVGTVLGLIEAGAAGAMPVAATESIAASPPPPAPAVPQAAPAPSAPASAAEHAGPAARKAADEKGIDVMGVAPTGPKATVTKADVASAPAPGPAPSSPAIAAPAATGAREERVRMTRFRKRIAERLKEAQNTAAMLTTFNEVDMTAVMTMRERYQDSFVKKHGVKLGFMSFFVKAAIDALHVYPAVNAEIDGDDIVYKHHYAIGVAVSTEQGLVVPVVQDADLMGLAEIEKKIGDLGKRARDGKLSIEEMSGGTFSITNGGTFGSLLSTPILNPPQVAILGMHKIQQRPMVMPDGAIAARPMMYLALSYDHRIIDGREAVSFLVRVKDCIEAPERMLLEA